MQVLKGVIGTCMICFLFFGCDNTPNPPSKQSVDNAGAASRSKYVPMDAEAASRSEYVLMDDVKYPNVKRMLKIKLPHRITEKRLREISLSIRRETPAEFKYLSIWYYLREISIKNGIWAKAQFYSDKPDDIEILCLTIPCYQELINAPYPEADKIIGVWIVERQHVSSRKVIYKKDGEFFCEDLQCGNSGGGTIYPKTASLYETKFVDKEDPDDEFYFINLALDLELHSEDGCYAIGKKITVRK